MIPDPPEALTDALRSRRWGLPDAGGWADQAAGRIDRMAAALEVYDAFTSYQAASDKYNWIAANSAAYGLIQKYRRNA